MDDLTEQASAHYLNSTLRERIVEHVFVGDALRRLWQRGVTDVEVLRSEFDAGGYDLVMSYKAITRHIQFKTKTLGGQTDKVKINLKLMDKPSGCVLWIVVTPDLEFDHYLWFGGAPGEPLPDISDNAVARHSKGTSLGEKRARPNHRVLRISRFEPLTHLDQVLTRLFGTIEDGAAPTASDQALG
ncbi:hypothetical protein SAMN05518849_11436 [Sphingobium sp. AP50]|uniref:hypothetical protein n=1 Tax=Sphingobium sp. AP50 TaxID=1884369 RepID=UPI0008B92188|nr:hypothetical protein [Sphingobium sp. AP50]SEJ80609.1 hypothetical protein SAMN05518849_11436 [Sphingobium sp. AP50]